MSFEKFTSWGAKHRNAISIDKGGSIGFASGFCIDHDIKAGHYASVYYDPTQKAMAFQFHQVKQEGATKLNERGAHGAYIGATSLLKRYHISDQKYTGSYEPQETSDPELGQLYVITIKDH